jgi:hypothetical protein
MQAASFHLILFSSPGRLAYRGRIALLEQYPEAKKDAEKASLLVKGRIAVASTSNTMTQHVISVH